MKKVLTAVFALCLTAQVFAQQGKSIQFREETYDFGTVAENKGPVTHEFVFTNNSSRPVRILTVQASCGCTTPGWSKDAVEPGQTGYIQASYNPAGRPGFFNKSLTVTTDLEANPIILQIKGTVSTDDVKPMENEFTVANGSLKFKVASFNMGKVFIKDEFVVREFAFINTGEKPVTFDPKFVSPKYIRVDVQPMTVPAGGKGMVRIGYNGKLKGQYGFQSDNVELSTTDETNPVKSFSVLATLEEFFPQLSQEELAKAPQLTLTSSSLDFGRLNNSSTTVVKEIQFTNTGRKELSLRSLQGNCTCIAASANKSTLKPGETSVIKVTFDPQGRKGTHTKAVTIYSNDPRNPVQRFTATAYVEN